MIRNSVLSLVHLRNNFRTGLTFIAFLLPLFLMGGKQPPQELQTVINRFFSLENTSIDITQTIHWRFYRDSSVVSLTMDIQDRGTFRILVPAFNLEMYVFGSTIQTINHGKQQILYDDASPNELLNQLFIGGNLADAKYKGEKILSSGRRQLNFKFSSDFSEWLKLSIIVGKDQIPTVINLVDYDENHYEIRLKYKNNFQFYDFSERTEQLSHYKTIDLRKKK